jgi:hypothetical protein
VLLKKRGFKEFIEDVKALNLIIVYIKGRDVLKQGKFLITRIYYIRI